MKIFFNRTYESPALLEEDFTQPSLKDDMQKTRQALEIAYAGFDNALEEDLIDSYIFEINSLLKRYKYLSALAGAEELAEPKSSHQQSPIRALVSHVFG